MERTHIASADCWCSPTVEYVAAKNASNQSGGSIDRAARPAGSGLEGNRDTI